MGLFFAKIIHQTHAGERMGRRAEIVEEMRSGRTGQGRRAKTSGFKCRSWKRMSQPEEMISKCHRNL
eukprot:126506-Hanusia_phi.AAC.1